MHNTTRITNKEINSNVSHKVNPYLSSEMYEFISDFPHKFYSINITNGKNFVKCSMINFTHLFTKILANNLENLVTYNILNNFKNP